MTSALSIDRRHTSVAKVSPRTITLGAGLTALTGLIHLVDAPEYYGEVHYIGVLFVLTAIGAAVSVVGITRGERWGWALALAIASSSAIAYVMSRTVGIPMFRENSWATFLEPMGLASLAVEAMLIIVATRVLARIGATDL